MKKTMNKALALVIVVVMLISMFPILAFADDSNLACPKLCEACANAGEEGCLHEGECADCAAIEAARKAEEDRLKAEEERLKAEQEEKERLEKEENDKKGQEQENNDGGEDVAKTITVNFYASSEASAELLDQVTLNEGEKISSEKMNAIAAKVSGIGDYAWWNIDKDAIFNAEEAVVAADGVVTINVFPRVSAQNDPDGDGGIVFGPFAMTTVRFHDENGVEIEALRQEISVGSKAKKPADPSIPSGYVSFRGWFTSRVGINDDSVPYDFDTAVGIEGVDLYAIFSDTYLISFKNGNDQVQHTSRVAPGASVYAPGIDIDGPSGTHFSYWYAEGDATKTPVSFPFAATKDITLCAEFSTEYTVYFVSSGTQVESNPVLVAPGNRVAEPVRPTRHGYNFKHWSTSENGAAYNFNNAVNNNLVLYAVWEAQTVNYTVVYWMERPNFSGTPTPGTAGDYNNVLTSTFTGSAGSKTNLTADDLAVDMAKYPLKYANVQEIHNQTIAGTGTTVVNVYCTRIVYTYVFNLADAAGSMQIKADGAGGRWYTGSEYTIQAKFEENIAERFPFEPKAEFKHTGDKKFVMWTASGVSHTSGWISIRPTVSTEMLSADGKTLTYNVTGSWTANTAPLKGRYYAEVLPHETAEYTYNGVGYVELKDLRQDTYNTSWIAKGLNGFESGVTLYAADRNKLDPDPGELDRYFMYKRLRYTLSFNTQAPSSGYGSVAPIPSKSGVMYEEQLIGSKPADPVRAGYTFKGWYLDKECTEAVYWEADGATPATVMGNADLTIFARWESDDFTITYYDKTVREAKLGTKGAEANQPLGSHPTSFEGIDHNYVVGQNVDGKGQFLGWVYYVGSVTVPFSVEMSVTKNYDVYASWKTTDFKVTYDANGGNGTPPVDGNAYNINQYTRVKYGSSLTSSNAGEVFAYWKVAGDTSGIIYYPDSYYLVKNDTTFLAQYLGMAESKELIYKANYTGAPNPSSVTTRVLRNSDIQLLGADTFTRVGYKLVGWTKNSNGTGTVYTPGSNNEYKTANDDTTEILYAKWEKVQTYTATFKIVNGSFTSTPTVYTVNAGDSLATTAGYNGPPSHKSEGLTGYGYNFEGWYTNYTGPGTGTKWDPNNHAANVLTSDIEITAVYSKEKLVVKVTFQYLNESGNQAEPVVFADIMKGTNWSAAGITVPNAPSTPTHIFTGWKVDKSGYNNNPTANGAINDDLIFTAQYRTRATWTINFAVDPASAGRGTVTNTKLTVREGLPLSTATGWATARPTATPATATATNYFTFTKWYGPGVGGADLSAAKIFDAGSYIPSANGETIYAAFGSNTKATLKIIGNTGSYTYDGNRQTVTGASVTGLKPGHVVYYKNMLIANASVSATDWTNGNKMMGLSWANIDIRENGVSVKEQYTPNVTDGWISITKRPISITLGNETRDWTGSTVTANLSVTSQAMSGNAGLVSGQRVDPLTVKASGINVGTKYYGDDAGSTPVNIKILANSTNVTNNYNITIVDGSLTIKALSSGKISVNLSGDAFVYDGLNHSLNAAVVSFGTNPSSPYKVYYRIDGGAWSETMPERKNAGNYLVEVYVDADGYENTSPKSATLLIKPYTITVKPRDNSKEFSKPDPNPLTKVDITAKPTNGVALDWPAGALDLWRESGDKSGNYTIRVKADPVLNSALTDAVAAANPNYNIVYKTGTFKIKPYKVIIEVDPVGTSLGADANKYYGKVDPILKVTLPNSLPAPIAGEPLTADMFVISRDPGEDVGLYNLRIEDLDNLQTKYVDSYEFDFVGTNKFEIMPRPVDVAVKNVSKIYGESDPEFGLLPFDAADSSIADLTGFNFAADFATLGITVSRSAAHADRENANEGDRKNDDTVIDLVATGVTTGVNGNYNFRSLTKGSLTINRRPVYIQANSRFGITVDGNRHSVSGYTVIGKAGASGLLDGHVLAPASVTAYAEASTAGDYMVHVVATGAIIQAGGTGENLVGNYQLIGRNGWLQLINPTPTVNYLSYTVNYYSDAIGAGGNFLGSISGSAPEGSTIPVAANYYRTTAMANAGYGYGRVYGSRVMTTNGQVINVLYVMGGAGEEEEPTGGEEEEPIEEPEVPTVDEPVEEPIEEPEIPEGPPASWALLNLILAIVTVIVGIVLLVSMFRRSKKDEEAENSDYAAEDEDEKRKSGIIWRVFGIIAAVIAPIVFFLTENMSNPMIFTDKWTLLMGLILLVQVVAVLLMRYVRNKDEDEKKENI